MENAVQINVALRLLLGKPSEDKPWVVIEHSSGKFVQFAGSVAEPLLLDLPWQPMSEAEFYRAVAYFKKLGVAGDEVEMFDLQGNRANPQFTFNMTFCSVHAAVEATLDIFNEVYGLAKESELVVATSWDTEAE